MFCCYTIGKKKVKVTLVQALRLCTGRTAHRGRRGIALLFHDFTKRGWGVTVTPRPLFTPRKDPVPIVQEAGWAPGLVWTGAENITPTGIRSPNRPARSQSLYWLSYRAHRKQGKTYRNCIREYVRTEIIFGPCITIESFEIWDDIWIEKSVEDDWG